MNNVFLNAIIKGFFAASSIAVGIYLSLWINKTIDYKRHCEMCLYKTRYDEGRPVNRKESYISMTYSEFENKFSINKSEVYKITKNLSCYVYPLYEHTDLVFYENGPYLSINNKEKSELVYIMFSNSNDLFKYKIYFNRIKSGYKHTFNTRINDSELLDIITGKITSRRDNNES